MPTYESWKYCEFKKEGVKCGEIADAECTGAGCLHKNHPKFVCNQHQEIVEQVSEALERMDKELG